MTTTRRPRRRAGARRVAASAILALVAGTVAACGSGPVSGPATTPAAGGRPAATAPPRAGPTDPTGRDRPIPPPAALEPFNALGAPDDGQWHAAGRRVDGVTAVYETSLVPPGGSEAAGLAWMDTHLLTARLYSGSRSPGGGPYRYTAPIQPADATTLVAAFNGGFLMDTAGGGYVTEGRTVVPPVPGAASLVIRADGTVDVGTWGADVTMAPDVVAVRQNLVPLVAGGAPTPGAARPDWQAWGNTCGATSCAHSVPGVEQQWRSGVGVTASGALVYVTGPLLTPMQLARLLAHAGVVRGMELDINPTWTVLATYDPLIAGGPASPDNGARLVPSTVQGPATFFDPSWGRDFVTMSARPTSPATGVAARPSDP